MIELRQVLPRRDGVTCFAASLPSVVYSRHSIPELSIVRIAMAGCARAIIESILRHIFEARGHSWLVAVATWNRKVCACQIEFGVLVHGERKSRRLETLHSVAVLAAVDVRRRGELTEVFVLVAISAGCELQLVHRCCARWRVALCTCNIRMFSL